MPVRTECNSSARFAGCGTRFSHNTAICQKAFQFAQVERFAEIVIEELEVGLEGFLVFIEAGSRYDDDSFESGQLAQTLRHLAAIEVWHLKIQKDNVRSKLLHNGQCCPPPMGHKHIVAPERQQDLQTFGRFQEVIGNEDAQSSR